MKRIEEFYNWAEQSGKRNQYRRSDFKPTREMIKLATQDFLNRGGKITKIETTISDDTIAYHKPKYNATVIGLHEEKASLSWSY